MTSTSQPLVAPTRAPLKVWLVLLLGIMSVSFAAIFIRYAQGEGIPSIVVAAGRLSVASLALTPAALLRHRAVIARINRRDWLLIGVSGLFLAFHFAAWVTSLEYTAVMISVVMVTSGPIWVALLEVIFLKAKLTRAVIAGIAVAVIGGVIIGFPSGGAEVSLDQRSLFGGLLALVGAIAVSVYVIIGRELRPRMPVIPYIWLVYSVAAILLLLGVAISGEPVTGYSVDGYIWIVILGLLPQLIGHSSFNYVLGYLPATLVAVTQQVEPVLPATAAFILFNEVPTAAQVIGSLILIGGVAVAILGSGSNKVETVLGDEE